MSVDLFRKYIDIINENSNEKSDGKGPNAFQRAYYSGEGPLPSEPMEIIDDPEEFAGLIRRAYNTPDGSDPDQNVQNADIRKMIKNVLLQLDPKEERIIRMRFGIGVPEMSLAEIGRKFGVAGETIRQLEARAIRKMKHPSRWPRRRPPLSGEFPTNTE